MGAGYRAQSPQRTLRDAASALVTPEFSRSLGYKICRGTHSRKKLEHTPENTASFFYFFFFFAEISTLSLNSILFIFFFKVKFAHNETDKSLDSF